MKSQKKTARGMVVKDIPTEPAAAEEEESEYDEEYESEEEEFSEALGNDPAVGNWTEKDKKDFDPRTDKLLDIKSDENYLMESL